MNNSVGMSGGSLRPLSTVAWGVGKVGSGELFYPSL